MSSHSGRTDSRQLGDDAIALSTGIGPASEEALRAVRTALQTPTLSAAYRAWDAAREALRQLEAWQRQARARVDQHGHFLLGAVKSAGLAETRGADAGAPHARRATVGSVGPTSGVDARASGASRVTDAAASDVPRAAGAGTLGATRVADADAGTRGATGAVGAVRPDVMPDTHAVTAARLPNPASELSTLTNAPATSADARLQSALDDIEAKSKRERSSLVQAETAAKTEILSRLRAHAERSPPTLRMWHRPVAGGARAILQAERPSADDALLLCWALTGQAPTRSDFLSDDATDDVSLGPTAFYADEAGASVEPRPTPDALTDALAHFREQPFLPIRGFVPFQVPGQSRMFRLVQRGPVLEVERVGDGAFQTVLETSDAQSVAGLFLRLRAEGKLNFELLLD